jgi:two-component system cell cycle response regulator
MSPERAAPISNWALPATGFRLAHCLLLAVREGCGMSEHGDQNTPPATRPTADDDAGIPQLVVVGGPSVGTAFQLTRAEAIIGRGEEADIRLPNPSLSRRHARLTVEANGVWIEDLGSRNGTFVGLDRVRGRTLVREGDHVALGIYTFLKLTRSRTFGELVAWAIRRGEGRATTIGSSDHLLTLLGSEYAYARRHGTPISLLFIRADAVSAVRDSGADSLAEEAMGHVGTAIDGAIRVEDCMARAGSDTLVILVRNSGGEAEQMAERIRTRVELLASRRGSRLVGHTITIVVLPLHPSASPTPGHAGGSVSPDEIMSTAQAVADPILRVNSNRVVLTEALAI